MKCQKKPCSKVKLDLQANVTCSMVVKMKSFSSDVTTKQMAISSALLDANQVLACQCYDVWL